MSEQTDIALPGGAAGADLPAPPELVELVEWHEAACARLLLADLPGSLLIGQEEFLLVGPPPLAAVHRLRATAGGFDAAVAGWEEAFRRAGAPPAVWLSPASTPADAAERLSRRGYRLARELRFRVLDRIPAFRNPHKGAHVAVRPLRPTDAELLARATVEAYGFRGHRARVEGELVRRACSRPEVRGFVGEVDGQLAGFTYGVWLEMICGNVAAATLPQFRQQGVGRVLWIRIVTDAFERGARYLWSRTDVPWYRSPTAAFRHQIWMRWPLPQRLLWNATRPLRRRWFRARRFRQAPAR